MQDKLNDLRGYGTVEKRVMIDNNISIGAKGFYAYLCSYAGNKDNAYPSTDLICHQLNISKGTLQKHIRELKEFKYISVEQIKEGGKFSHNVYYLLPPVPQNLVHGNLVNENLVHENLDTKNNSIKINSIKNNSNNILPCEVEEVSEKNKIDYKAIVEDYNSITGVTKVRSLTDKRKKQLNTRLKEHGEDSLNIVMQNIKTSDFLRGYNKTNWKMDFDWLVNPNNYIKILEGKYNKQNSTNKATKPQSNINRPTVKTDEENGNEPAWKDWD